MSAALPPIEEGDGEREIIVGDLVTLDKKVWRVGLKNESRMRLDPVTGYVVKIGETDVPTYGSSINVSASSVLDRVEEEDLKDNERRRVAKLIQRGQQEDRIMEETTTGTAAPAQPAKPKPIFKISPKGKPVTSPVGKAAAPAAAPATPAVSAVKKANEERKANLAAKKATAGTTPKAPREKKEKVKQACKCGCGLMVAGFFAQGHDARFKGWMKKLQRGEMKVKDLPEPVQKAYQWRKLGDGMVPTKNYNGEAYTPYPDADEA